MALRQTSLAFGLEGVVLAEGHHILVSVYQDGIQCPLNLDLSVQLVKDLHPCYYIETIYQARDKDGGASLQGCLMNLLYNQVGPIYVIGS